MRRELEKIVLDSVVDTFDMDKRKINKFFKFSEIMAFILIYSGLAIICIELSGIDTGNLFIYAWVIDFITWVLYFVFLKLTD